MNFHFKAIKKEMVSVHIWVERAYWELSVFLKDTTQWPGKGSNLDCTIRSTAQKTLGQRAVQPDPKERVQIKLKRNCCLAYVTK